MSRRSGRLLALALSLVLVGILGAGAIQTSLGKVEVREVSLVTGVGTLTGYLLVPGTATVDSPAPAIVTSHGYLNNREMQDQNYVELSRRGYVVFAMNAYKHGDSSVPDKRFADSASVRSGGMVDAVEYLSTLPFVDKDNIGVTGHSMGGGFAITTATYYTGLERKALAEGTSPAEAKSRNRLAAALPVGMYPDVLAATADRSGASGFLCDLGVVMGSYDEFFAAEGNSGRELLSGKLSHDLLAVQTGLDLPGALEEGKTYSNPANGHVLALYNPRETHAQNHFSPASAGDVVSFFQGVMPPPRPLPAGNQTWWLKELFNLVGLVGFFMFLLPFAELLLSLPFFDGLRAKAVPALPPLEGGKGRRRFVIANAVNVLSGAILVFPLMMAGYLLLPGPWLPQETTGGIAIWALGCALVGLLAIRIGSGKFKGRCAEFGVATTARSLGKTFLLALAVAAGAFSLLFLADYLYQVDFRVWTFDLRVFSAAKLWVALKYLPFFLAFFIVNSLMTGRGLFPNWSERKQDLMAALLNCLVPALFILASFLPILWSGSTLWGLVFAPGSLLSGAGALVPILMIPFLPILGIAGWLDARLYRMTGSIWAGAILNSLLVTMITVANTSFSFPY